MDTSAIIYTFSKAGTTTKLNKEEGKKFKVYFLILHKV